MRVARTIGRLAARLVLGLVFAIVAAMLLLRLWLETPAGERWLAGMATDGASSAIAGRLEIERIDLRGWNAAVARQLRVVAPDGTPAASASTLAVRVSLLSLLTARPRIEDLEVEGLTALLTASPDGSNALSRALAVPQAGGDDGGGLVLAVERLRVDAHRLSYREAAGAPPSLAAEAALLEGSLRIETGTIRLSAAVEMSLAAPIDGRLLADVQAQLLADGTLRISKLEATLPGKIRVHASAMPDPAGSRATQQPPQPRPSPASGLRIPLTRVLVELPPRGLVPYRGPALANAVRGEAQVSYLGGELAFDASLHPAGPGRVALRGGMSGDPSRFRLDLDVHGVDPASLLSSAPQGAIFLSIAAGGAARAPPEASLDVKAHLGAGTKLAGTKLGPGVAELTLRGNSWRLDRLTLDLPGARLTGHVAGAGSAPPTGTLRLESRDLRPLASLARALGAPLPSLGGDACLVATAHGKGGPRRALDLRLSSRSLQIGDQRIRGLVAGLRQRGASARAHARAVTPEGAVAFAARARRTAPGSLRLLGLRADLPGGGWRLVKPALIAWGGGAFAVDGLELAGPGRISLDLKVAATRRRRLPRALHASLRAEGIRLSSLALLLPGSRPDGLLDGRLSLGGSVTEPTLDVLVEAARLSLRGVPLGPLRIALQLDRRRVQATATLAPGGAPVSLSVDAAAPAGRPPLWTREGLTTAKAEANLTIRRLNLGALAGLGVAPAGLAGRLRADLAFRGTLAEPRVQGVVDVAGVALPGRPAAGPLPPAGLTFLVTGDRARTSVELFAGIAGVPSVNGTAILSAPLLSALRPGDRLRRAPLEGTLDMAGPLRLRGDGAKASHVEIHARLQGSLGQPRLELRAEARELALRRTAVGDLSGRAALAPGRWGGELRAAPAAGGELVARVDFREGGGASEAELSARRARLDLLSAVPGLGEVSGAWLDGRLRVSRSGRGPPVIDGMLHGGADAVEIPAYGKLRDLALSLAGSGQTLRLSRLATLGAELTGRLHWSEQGWDGEAAASFDAFPVPSPGLPFAALTTRVRARLQARRALTGEVVVDAGELSVPRPLQAPDLLPTRLPRSIRVHDPSKGPSPAGPSFLASWLAGHPLRLTVRVSPGFWIRTPEARAQVQANVTAVSRRGQIVLVGPVRVQPGTVVLLGRRFVIERFDLKFAGTPRPDPAIDGLLAYRAGDSTVEIQLLGTLQDPDVHVASDPPMQTSEIASLFAAGGPTGAAAPSPGLGGLLLSGAANAALGQLRNAFAGALPIDVLNVQLGAQGQTERLEAGTYVTPDLFVSFVRNFLATGAENTNEVQAEYRISSSLSARTYFGDQQAGGVSLLWHHRFRSRAQREAASANAAARRGRRQQGLPETRTGGSGASGGEPVPR